MIITGDFEYAAQDSIKFFELFDPISQVRFLHIPKNREMFGFCFKPLGVGRGRQRQGGRSGEQCGN